VSVIHFFICAVSKFRNNNQQLPRFCYLSVGVF